MNSNEFYKKVKELQATGVLDIPGSPFELEEVTITVRLPRFIARLPEMTSFIEDATPSLSKCPVTFTSLIEEAVLASMVHDKIMFQVLLSSFTIWQFKMGAKGDKA